MIKEIKEIKELENYVIENKYELSNLLNAMQGNCEKGYIYVLTNKNLKNDVKLYSTTSKIRYKIYEIKKS